MKTKTIVTVTFETDHQDTMEAEYDTEEYLSSIPKYMWKEYFVGNKPEHLVVSAELINE